MDYKNLEYFMKAQKCYDQGRDGIVEEPPVYVYYAYLKPT